MHQDVHAFAGPYVLGAVSAAEQRAFVRHLARCSTCAAETAGLQETASRLATATAAAPPARMRVTVLAQIGGVRQVPPPRRAVHTRPSRRRTRLRRVGLPGLTSDRPRSIALRAPRVLTALTAGGAVACVAVSVVAGVSAERSQDQYARALAQERALTSVISAPDARTVTASASGGGTATVVVSRARGQIVFASAGFPRLPESKAYALWLIGPTSTRPAGLVRPDAAGRIPPLVAGDLNDADRVGVTVEPSGGSPRPTTAPVLALPIT
ncbi:anti-sigma factor [Spirillospora sp. NPDC047279]|uniref:anti-sigma factor n=1 Tax=Spirillospora sp. NPDC047279 TaxID=3155478 RepID=UPI0033D33721